MMGQLSDHYEQGLARLAVWRRVHEYGFALPSFESELNSAEAWAELTYIWRSIVCKRRVDQLMREAAYCEYCCVHRSQQGNLGKGYCQPQITIGRMLANSYGDFLDVDDHHRSDRRQQK